MKLPATLLLCCLVQIASLCAQNTSQKSATHRDKGTMVLTLGTDTTVIQSFEIRGDSIFSKILLLPRGIQYVEGRGTFFPDGRLKSMTSTVSGLSPNGELVENQQTTLRTSADSTFISIKRGETVSHRSFAGHCWVTNSADAASFHLFPYRGFYAPKTVGDTLVSQHVSGLGERKFNVSRTQKNTVTLGSSLMGYLTLTLDSKNRIQSVDGRGSSLNFTAKAYRKANFESLKAHFIQKELKAGVMPSLTTRDTVRFSQGDQELTINYWRPLARGRKIFGEIVPMNRFWRLGANNATELSTNQTLVFGDQKLPAGKYTLFVMPTEGAWTLMINSKTGIWGTEYDAAADVLRLPLKVETLPKHVEQLTISLESLRDNRGSLSIAWETTKASLVFGVE